jgi:hypothetical protein
MCLKSGFSREPVKGVDFGTLTVLDGVAVFELEALVAAEIVAGAVEDASEIGVAVGVEVVGDGLGVEGEGGGVVSKGAGGQAVGLAPSIRGREEENPEPSRNGQNHTPC